MADGLSVYVGKKLLDLLFGNTAYTIPATLSAAALTTMPTDRSGTGLAEVTNANNYSRTGVTNNATNFTTSTGTTSEIKGLGANIVFPTPSGSWGTVLGIGFSDSGTYGAGNWIAFYTLSVGQAISAANPLIIAAANLTLT